MRRILTALLCSSLLIGGSAAATDAAEVQSQSPAPNFVSFRLVPGQSDFNEYLENISMRGCPATTGPMINGVTAAVTAATCLGFPGDQFLTFPYRSPSGQTVVRSTVILFQKVDFMFLNYAEEFQATYGNPVRTASRLDGSVEAVWRQGDLVIRLALPSEHPFGYVEYTSAALEAKLANESLATANVAAGG